MPRLPADKRNACFCAVLFANIIGNSNACLIFCLRFWRLMEKGDENRVKSMINRPLCFVISLTCSGNCVCPNFFTTVNWDQWWYSKTCDIGGIYNRVTFFNTSYMAFQFFFMLLCFMIAQSASNIKIICDT